MPNERRAIRIHVTGRVQGVGFRFWTHEEAQALGLDGWVRNESDGTVSVLAAGAAGRLDRFVESLRTGPAGAVVTGVTIQPANPAEVSAGFRILR